MPRFNKYIVPNLSFIESLINHYSGLPNQYDEVYSYVLQAFESYIDTYDTSKNLDNWIHIVTKRQVYKFMKMNQRAKGVLFDMDNVKGDVDYYNAYPDSKTNHNDPLDMAYYQEHLEDDLYQALMSLKDIHRVPLILKYIEGWSIKDITAHELKRGTIKWMSINAIKTRIKVALDTLKGKIKT